MSQRPRKSRMAALALLLAAAVGCGYYFYPREPAPTYMTVPAERRDITSQVFATGTLEGRVEVDVGAQVSGKIVKLHVGTGDRVKKGDLLAEIDPDLQENNLRKARAELKRIAAEMHSKSADLKKKKATYERDRKLLSLRATSQQDFETSEAEYEMAKAALDSLQAQCEQAEIEVATAETNLGYTKIVAPMDGTVYGVPVEEGQTVNANQTTPTILRLAVLDTMTVKAEISEADVVKVTEGMPCYFTILGLPERRFSATLREIKLAPSSADETSSSSSSSSSSTSSAIYYNALLDVDNSEGILRIDMTADVTIDIASAKDALAVPLTALRSDGAGKVTVYVLGEGGAVDRRECLAGIRDDRYVEIKEGLEEGDRIVLGDDVRSTEAQALEENKRRHRGPF